MLVDSVAMILDHEDGPLGGVALQLVRLGIDTVYSNDLDEASLLARQESRRLAAILLPSDVTLERVDEVIARVGRHAHVTSSSLAVLGPRPDDSRCEALRKKGICWRLWAPYEEPALRFVARAPMWHDRDEDLRLDLRVPTTLAAVAHQDGLERHVRVGDLTASGAYLETPSPFAAGARVSVRIDLPSEPVELDADLRWSNGDGPSGVPVAARPRGMGIEFIDPNAEARSLIAAHLQRELTRYLL